MAKLKYFLILICLQSFLVNAQARFDFFGIENGLSQSNVRAIVQDKEGFLWMGTWDGLNRYDGYSFKQYQYNPTENKSLSQNNIVNLAVDKNDKIWIAFVDGRIDLFDKKKEEFTPVKVNNKFLIVSIYQFVKEDVKGNFWAVFENKLIKIEPETLNATEHFTFNNISQYKFNNSNYVALIDSNRIYIVNENEDIFYFDNDFEVIHLYKNSNGNILFASFDGKLFEFNIKTKQITLIKDFHDVNNENVIIYSILEDSQNRLWIASSIGLFCSINFLSTNEKTFFKKIDLNSETKQNYGNEVFFSLYEDYSGIIWVGHWTGLFKINPQRKNFKSLPFQRKYSEVFGNNFPISFYSMNDSVMLIGTTDGFFIYDINKNKTQKFTSKNSSLSNSAVYFIFKDSKERIWLGTKNGLNLFDYVSKKFQPFLIGQKNDQNKTTIYSIAEKFDGQLIIGTAHGLIIFNPESKRFNIYTFESNIQSEGISYILSLLIEGNQLWAGTNGEGLLKINLDDMSFKRFIVEKGNSNSLSHNKVMALHKDKENRLWIATLGGGINLLESDEKTFRHFNINNGLPNNSVYGFVEDDNNNLWFSTNNGISKINYSDFSINNYSTEDGLINIEYNQNAYYKNNSGKIFFGGINGIVYFNPNEIKINNTKPKIAITDFKLFNKSRKDLLNNETITLNYNENFFSFELTALLFDNPKENKYAYKLEGLNEDWVFTDTRRVIDFSNLSPGEYLFKAKAANEDDVWCDEKILARIKIIPPFWATLWFRLLSITLIFISIIYVVRNQIQKKYQMMIDKLEKEKLIIEERQKTRNKIARDLHDDLASTVSSAGFYLQTAKQIFSEDKEKAKEYLEKSSQILEEAEQSMSDIVWSVSPNYDSIENLILRIKILAGELCSANNIKLNFNSKIESGNFISEDDRRNLYLVFKEAFMNSIKHSGTKEIYITINCIDNEFYLELIDKGKGFRFDTREHKLGGNGLSNIRKRCSEINATFEINSVIGEGTTVKITLSKN